ncbi:MAG: DUF3800 domain-containing protein [Deltaproteobacteria bacterium]|nr:DUF3800 domain-containing protein [Deltaproteobacteria bacterium]
MIEYPLCVKHTAFGASVESAGLQIADIIAGAHGHLYRAVSTGKEDEYSNKLEQLLTLKLPEISVWPSEDIERWPDTPPGVEDPLMYTAEIIAKLPGTKT